MAVGLGGLVLGLEKKSVEEWNIFLYVSFDFWMFVIIVFLGLGVSKPIYGHVWSICSFKRVMDFKNSL